MNPTTNVSPKNPKIIIFKFAYSKFNSDPVKELNEGRIKPTKKKAIISAMVL